MRTASPSAVCVKTLSSSTSTSASRSARLIRSSGPSPASMQREGAALVLGERLPVAYPCGEHLDRVGLRVQALALGPAGLADDLVDRRLELVEVAAEAIARSPASETASTRSRSAVTGVRRRWDRSETDSRSRSSSSSMRSTSRSIAPASSCTSGGPLTAATGSGDAVRPSAWVCSASCRIGWTKERPSRSTTTSDPTSRARPRQRQQPPGQADDGRRGRARATITRITGVWDGRAELPPRETGTRICEPAGDVVDAGAPGVARVEHPGVLAGVGPDPDAVGVEHRGARGVRQSPLMRSR